jgi:hypothetical protein
MPEQLLLREALLPSMKAWVVVRTPAYFRDLRPVAVVRSGPKSSPTEGSNSQYIICDSLARSL